MNDYMRALHQRFFREPDVSELEEDIENTRQEVRDFLDKMQRRRLMHLVDSQNLLKEEISLASFAAGFKLAWGLCKDCLLYTSPWPALPRDSNWPGG